MMTPEYSRNIDAAVAGQTRIGRANDRLTIAIVGGSLRAASIIRLLNEVDNIRVAAVCAQNDTSPAARLAGDLGMFFTRDYTEIFQVPDLDLIIDMSDDPHMNALLNEQRPVSVELVGVSGSELVWGLLVAKKRGEEQEKLFVELQVAYDKIRSHERRLQSSKEALEQANEELESRLAEIFFTHEFFKALTSFTTIDDVCSLIVDGANGILGAEISCVYLHDPERHVLTLRASQGRPESAFRDTVPDTDTLLGSAFREGVVQEADVALGADSAGWFAVSEEIRSQAALPLRMGDYTFGVMLVASGTYRELTSMELERLQVISNQASLSLQNALLHEELELLSITDRLTELYNHGYLQQRLDEELHRADRFGRTLSLIMMDIDDFKSFNDTYGHPKGDIVLKTVSRAIRECLRDVDIAARYGGEEFVVILPDTDAEGALAVAERIRVRVAESGFEQYEGGPLLHWTLSLGVATYPEHAQSHNRLIEAADAAMYRAKRAGKNRVELAGG